MKLEGVSEDQNSYSKQNGKVEHANGATDDEKAILVSKEAITTKTLGKLQDEKAKCLDWGNKLSGLSYKGKDGDEYELFWQSNSPTAITIKIPCNIESSSSTIYIYISFHLKMCMKDFLNTYS